MSALFSSFFAIKDFSSVTPLVRLWSLRALVIARAYRKFLLADEYSDSDVAGALGLLKDGDESAYNRAVAEKLMREAHAQAEANIAECVPSELLQRNLARIAELIGLNETESQILCLVTYLMRDRFLRTVTDMLGQITFNEIFDAIGAILAIPVEDIRDALAPKSKLIRTGIVQLDASCASLMSAKLDVLSDTLVDSIHSFELDSDQLLKGIACRCDSPIMSRTDYVAIDDSVQLISGLLQNSIATRRGGTNIFIYGTPGTGKSQLVRVIAQQLGVPLFEVTSETALGNPIDGERRLRALTAAQTILAQQPALMLFDEVEDVFNDANLAAGAKSVAQKCKAWINRTLETNPVATFWVSNNVTCMDPAFIRRFDIVLELPNPTLEQTESIIGDLCCGMVTASTSRRIASNSAVSPAIIARASSVASRLREQFPDTVFEDTFERLLNATLKAQGHSTIRPNAPEIKCLDYNPRFINAEIDVEQIASGLKYHRDARILLWGGPGTGKTGFGHWLSERLAVPLHTKRASDLLTKSVGGTEHNLSQAFADARNAGAVLMIDEVDSFMRDRRSAMHSWEVTQVNEMLTQMDSFDGIFIATTNLLDSIDPASMRRFDLIAGFDWMRPEQVEEMLIGICREFSLALPDEAQRRAVVGLSNLAPGDFSAIRRQSRFRPLSSVDAVIAELKKASAAKSQESRRPMGFVQ